MFTDLVIGTVLWALLLWLVRWNEPYAEYYRDPPLFPKTFGEMYANFMFAFLLFVGAIYLAMFVEDAVGFNFWLMFTILVVFAAWSTHESLTRPN